MLDKLVEELSRAGLCLKEAKTKILTTDPETSSLDSPLLVDIAGCMVEVLRQNDTHKYLGRVFSGDLRKRGDINLRHRMQCGWMKYSHFRQVLQNRHIPITLRLKLFDAVITPTVLYSLSSTPLTSTQLERLNACQRRMLRKIVGWRRVGDESWASTGGRMKARLDAALQRHPITEWSICRNNRRDALVQRAAEGSAPKYASLAYRWTPTETAEPNEPLPCRSRGRPRQRCF